VSTTRLHTEPEFRPNEFYEMLLRIKSDQPRRYAREVSPGLQVIVGRYSDLKRAHEKVKAAA
jgi:hypothetical protein